MLVSSLAFLLSLAAAAAQDGSVCVCVNPSQCVEGRLKDEMAVKEANPDDFHNGEGLLSERFGTCDWEQVCCAVPPHIQIPGQPSAPQPDRSSEEDNSKEDASKEDKSKEDNSKEDNSKEDSSKEDKSKGDSSEEEGDDDPDLPRVGDLKGCGVRRRPPLGLPIDLRITGLKGPKKTFYGEAPWMVRILGENGFVCGGTLLNPRVVLTAAHCLKIKTCEGIQICCPVRGGPNPNPNPGSRTTPPPFPPPPTPGGILLPQRARLQGCGVRRFPGGSNRGLDLDTRISGGSGVAENTFYGEAPWMVRILQKGKPICGGSLIGEQVVLTGAHCVNGKLVEDLTIEAGEWDATSEKEPLSPQRQQALNVVRHPDFNDKNLQHDVALIFLRAPVKTSDVVDTICTPDGLNNVDVDSCVATGWGKTDIGKRFQLQPILRKVSMPFIDRDSCQKRLRETRLSQYFSLLPGFICAGGVADGDTCEGDGGGPLYCPMKNEPNRMAVVGITAWGIECGKGNPTVFASVPDYMNWISQQLNNERWYQG